MNSMEILKTIIAVFSILILLVLEIIVQIVGIRTIIRHRTPVNQDPKTAFWNGVIICSIIVAVGVVFVAIGSGWLVGK